MADAKTIPLESIRVDGATQPRCMIDEAAVAEYAEDMRDGFPFPPVTVFHDGAVNWLADGFHRYHGARRAGLDSILARVESGTVTDARWFACGANRTHGLRRTNADKRRAVEMALKEHPEKSDRAIAEHVGVSDPFVGAVRREVLTVSTSTRTGSDGKQYPLPPPRPIPPVPPPLPPMPGETDGETPAPGWKPPLPRALGELTDNERHIAERVDRESPGINGYVADYMLDHPNVSYCQALAIVKRKHDADDDNDKPAKVLDAVGREVPPEKWELWQRRQETQDLLTLLSRVRGAVRQYQERSDPLFAQVNYSSLMAHLDQAYADLEVGKPYAVCPSCQGLLGCRLCGGSGLLSKFRWDTCVSREQKEAVAGGQEA